MTARKRSKERQKAVSQKVLEEVHRALYCDSEWNENEVYGQRFRKILERSNLDSGDFRVETEIAKEFRRRIERKLKGVEPLDKSLVFYKILKRIESSQVNREVLISEIDSHSEECIVFNLNLLESSGLIKKGSHAYNLPASFRKLFLKTK